MQVLVEVSGRHGVEQLAVHAEVAVDFRPPDSSELTDRIVLCPCHGVVYKPFTRATLLKVAFNDSHHFHGPDFGIYVYDYPRTGFFKSLRSGQS